MTDIDNMSKETTSDLEENKINIQATMDDVEKLQQSHSEATDELSLNSANFRQLSTDLQTDIVKKLDSWLTRHGDQSGLKKEMANEIMTLVEEQRQKSKEKLPQLDDVTRTLVQMTEGIEEDSKEICSQIEDKMQLLLKNHQQTQEHLEEMVKMKQRKKMKSQEKIVKEMMKLEEKRDEEIKKAQEEKKKLQVKLDKEIRTLQEEMKKSQEKIDEKMMKSQETLAKEMEQLMADLLQPLRECSATTSRECGDESHDIPAGSSSLNEDVPQ